MVSFAKPVLKEPILHSMNVNPAPGTASPAMTTHPVTSVSTVAPSVPTQINVNVPPVSICLSNMKNAKTVLIIVTHVLMQKCALNVRNLYNLIPTENVQKWSQYY